MKNRIAMWSKTKKVVVAGIATALVAIAGTVGYMAYNTTATEAASCPPNDIMPCGAWTPSAFISKLRANKPSDMQTIYADWRYNLPASEYANFQNYAKAGKINPDNGNVTVDGVTIGYDGLSLGRKSKGSLSAPVSINGRTYYQSHIKDLTRYYNDAMVLFDARGNVQTVIMDLCGNPIKVTPNNPTYSCDALNVRQDGRNTFTFSADVKALNGAKITKLVYEFGDGNSATVGAGQSYTYTYAKDDNTARTYTAKVTAYVKTTFSRGEFAIPVTAACQKQVPVQPAPAPAVSIEKVVDGVETKDIPLNTNFTYTVKVTNKGNVDLTNVVVTDPSPDAKITFVSANPGSIVNNALNYTVPKLAVGQYVTINITAKLTDYFTGGIKNTACVQSNETAQICDPATITTKKPDVTITKLVNGAETAKVAVDENFTYTLRVTNNGEVALTNVVVSDPAPANVQFVSSDNGTVNGNIFSYTIPSLAVGAHVDSTITAKATAYVPTAIVNTACVNAPEVNPTKPNENDACDDATVTVKKPHVAIAKMVNNQQAITTKAGETFTYTITVTNDGEVALVNAVVTDKAPANIQFIATDKGMITNNILRYTIPSLGVGQSTVIAVTAKALTYVSTTMVNTACVNAAEVNPTEPAKDDACDTADVNVEKAKVANVGITKVVNGKETDEVAVGESFVYTVRVTNNGQIALANVVITDQAPANVQFVSTDQGMITSNMLSYTIPTLAIGQSAEIKITAKVTQYTPETIKNTACVNAPEINPGEPTKTDACDDATVTVTEPGKVPVCDSKTGNKITVPTTEANKYKPVDSIECTRVSVCDPATKTIIGDIKYTDKDKYAPVDSDQCVKMSVCIIADGTGVMTPISKDQFDPKKQSTNPADCVLIPVCRLSDKTKVGIKESQFDTALYSKNMNDCVTQPKPQVLPAVMPNTGAGNVISMFLGATLFGGIFHRLVLNRRQKS